ncbi:uncharacterized protein LOC118504202 [Anopheles stephensi]|uniref:uncharacterized protein LOC118504202 n=1 Tax=Anopheles stephensi TaxID=30069 RepID=UPI001658864F|nr:uncharacterized protein LOC118504202 [Anopheles stephensi]
MVKEPESGSSSVNYFHVFSSFCLATTLFDLREDCSKMACLPQSAFAVHKIRQAQNNKDLTVARMTGDKQGPRYLNKNTLDLTPVKYNGKLMNSIWGLYNRYSPHNFKKNNGSYGSFFGMQQPFAVACSPMEKEQPVTNPADQN